ncbi:hypothetical protein GCM10009534_50300 [Kribbella sandramycini]
MFPTTTPTPTPTADPTAKAKTQILANYSTFIVTLDTGFRDGGPDVSYARFMTGDALESLKHSTTFNKGFHRAKVTGYLRLLESRVSAPDLKAKVPTATITACVIDNMSAVSARNGKQLIKPAGKITRLDKVQLVKGKWLIFSTDTRVASFGCSK